MGKTLKELQDEIEIAKELVIEAEKTYRDAAMQAFEEGRLEEKVHASWREIVGENGKKVYCDACYRISPQGLKHERCPKCGAVMSNPSIIYHEVQKPQFIKKVNEKPVVKETASGESGKDKAESAETASDKSSANTPIAPQNAPYPMGAKKTEQTRLAPVDENTVLAADKEATLKKGERIAADVTGGDRGEVASRIIKAFHSAKFTYKDLKKLTGLSESSIANWATKQSTPRDTAYSLLCKAYKEQFGKDYVYAR